MSETVTITCDRDALSWAVYGRAFKDLSPPSGYELVGTFALAYEYPNDVFLGSAQAAVVGAGVGKAIRARLRQKPKPRILTLTEADGTVKTAEIGKNAFVRLIEDGDLKPPYWS